MQLGIAISSNFEDIEYDLLRMGIDIFDLGSSRLSLRRLLAILKRLGSDSAYAHAIHGPKVEWSTEAHLMASACDRISALTYVVGQLFVAMGGESPVPKFEPLPRPGSKQKPRGLRALVTELGAKRG